MTVDLVIFDCDGVLVDSEPASDRVISDFLTENGLTVTPSEVHSLFVGGTMASVGEEAMRRGAVLPEGWLEALYARVFDRLGAGVPVIAGVTEMIDLLDTRGIAKAIASNGPVRKMEITLTPSGLLDRFAPYIYSGHDHGPKPAPDMIYRIMTDLGVEPARAVMIDDTPTGCRAAQAAGIRCFGFAPDGNAARFAGTGAEMVRSLDEVQDRLGLRG